MFTSLNIYLKIILILIMSFLISYFCGKIIIKLQKRNNISQPLKEELSIIHENKKATPTMGGIGIVIGIILSIFIIDYKLFSNKLLLFILIFSLLFSLIGLFDDLMKLSFKNNKGISGKLRLFLEILLAMIFLRLINYQNINNHYFIVFNNYFYIGGFVIFILIFILVGSSNSMNLTDGLDGLASSIYIIMLLPFIIYLFKNNYYEIGLFLLASLGSVIGFIFHNINPSKLFMGDSGSLYLGSIIGLVAISFHLEYVLFISGIMLVVETLSVIIQVFVYKLTHRRVFKMAPLHHHFELKGLNENKIVLIYILISYFFSLIATMVII